MIKIAHRGNIDGPKPEYENSPAYIQDALRLGYDVELDVWLIDNDLFLGHDNPEYAVNIEFLRNKKFWCHCKNIDALQYLLQENIRCFYHDVDDATLTSDGYIWTYPSRSITQKSICVMPERDNWIIPEAAAGFCSDYMDAQSRNNNTIKTTKTYILEIDGIICSTQNRNFQNSQPFRERIEKLNKLYDEGNKIIFHTDRGMDLFNLRFTAEQEFWSFTYKQLQDWGVKFHHLYLGKPYGDIVIDNNSTRYENVVYKF